MIKIVFFSSLVAIALCDVSEYYTTSTPPPPPKPYAFGYAAGRFPGHIDRTHSEISDGEVVHGTYSYVDPKFRIRTVTYTADKNGFHPVLNYNPSPIPQDTAAVAHAKERHYNQFQAIANSHQAGQVVAPGQTDAFLQVARKHDQLYQQIVAEHARLGYEAKLAAEKEAQLPQENAYDEQFLQH